MISSIKNSLTKHFCYPEAGKRALPTFLLAGISTATTGNILNHFLRSFYLVGYDRWTTYSASFSILAPLCSSVASKLSLIWTRFQCQRCLNRGQAIPASLFKAIRASKNTLDGLDRSGINLWDLPVENRVTLREEFNNLVDRCINRVTNLDSHEQLQIFQDNRLLIEFFAMPIWRNCNINLFMKALEISKGGLFLY